MKQVKIVSISLTNWKAHKNLIINFSDRTVISGDNGVGKSTIQDAVLWTWFGKDQFDRKDFEITPIIDGKRLERIDSESEVIANIDGTEVKLRRVYHQKWRRPRGQEEEVFDGCETLYYINDVPKKAGEYSSFISTIVDESVFKLITNPSAFLDLHWTKQREFLFQIGGVLSDIEIGKTDPRFSQLLELLNGKSLADYKKEISATKKKLKTDLDDVQPKIDQTYKLMPEEKDFEKIASDIEKVDNDIATIELSINSKLEAHNSLFKENQTKQTNINNLKAKQQEVVNTATNKARQDAFEANQEHNSLGNNIKLEEQKLNSEKNLLGLINPKIKDLENKIEINEALSVKLRTEWTEKNGSELVFDDKYFHCPTCKREFESGDIESKKSELLLNFKNKKAEAIADINKRGLDLKGKTEDFKKTIQDLKNEFSEKELLINNYEIEITKLKEKQSLLILSEPKKVVPEELEEWRSLLQEINKIQETISEEIPVDNSELIQQKNVLISNRDNLKEELGTKQLIFKYKNEITILTEKGKDLAQQIASLEKQEFTIDDFNRVKIEECDKRVNSLFKVVRFQLFDKTNEGNEFECCIATNKSGVPISATNTAQQINAGIDIINLLSSFYNVSAPIFCDRAESNNNYLESDAQVVLLKVTNEKELTIK